MAALNFAIEPHQSARFRYPNHHRLGQGTALRKIERAWSGLDGALLHIKTKQPSTGPTASESPAHPLVNLFTIRLGTRLDWRGSLRNAFMAVLCARAAGCGGGNSTPSPSPTPNPTPSTHHYRTITSNTSRRLRDFGITRFPQLRPLRPTWLTATSSPTNGISVTARNSPGPPGHVYQGDGPMTVTLTVTDPKGATASDTKSIVVGGMTGTWLVDIPSFVRLQLDLQQKGTVVTGTFVQLQDGPTTPKGTSGKTDPAEPGKIDASGNVEIRLKVGRFLGFLYPRHDGYDRPKNHGWTLRLRLRRGRVHRDETVRGCVLGGWDQRADLADLHPTLRLVIVSSVRLRGQPGR